MSIRIKKNLIIIASLIFVLAIFFGVYQAQMLAKAHNTFENYYSFRGCEKLISRTDTEGVCQLKSGEMIKIVKVDKRWFLDGDLTCGFFCF